MSLESHKVYVHGKESVKTAQNVIELALEEFGPFVMSLSNDKAITNPQFRALHVWCGLCAQAMNDAGMTCEILHPFTKQVIEMPWTKELFKENIYKFVLKAMTGATSTKEQTTVTPDKVAMVIAKRFAENGMVCPPWPSIR